MRRAVFFKNKRAALLIVLMLAISVQAKNVHPNNFDKTEWTTLKKKLKIKDYKPEKKKEEEKKDKKKKKGKIYELTDNAKSAIKWTLFALLIAGLLILVLRDLGINPFGKRNKGTQINIALEELEENLDTAAIDPHLYEAIKNKNYKLAIRLYYLMIIQKLALKGKIHWKKYKTNKQYLHELRNKDEYPVLKDLTLTYEKSWFGEHDIDEYEYDRLNPRFVNFLQNIH